MLISAYFLSVLSLDEIQLRIAGFEPTFLPGNGKTLLLMHLSVHIGFTIYKFVYIIAVSVLISR